jgi:quercetin dioxygenase-like cupin family protein
VKRIIVADVPAVISSNPDLTDVAVRNLIDRSSVNARCGMLSIAEFAPRGCHKLHRHHASAQISYLISGEGEHLTENGAVAINAGDATYVPCNSWHGFRNTGCDSALLLSAYSPAADLAAAGYESYSGELDPSRRPSLVKITLAPTQSSGGTPCPAALFPNKSLMGNAIGFDNFLLGTSTITGAGGPYEHRRLPRGEEFLFILEGEGEYLTLEGPMRLVKGDIVYIPARELHGFRSREGAMIRVVFGSFGPE